MWWLYEPRSKDNYDDSESGGEDSSLRWYQILLLPFSPLLMLLVFIFPLLALIALFFRDVYINLSGSVKCGTVAHPLLDYALVAWMILPAVFIMDYSGGMPGHWTSILYLFIGFFAISPALALFLHWLLKLHMFLRAKLSVRPFFLVAVLLGTGIAALVLFWNVPPPPAPLPTAADNTPVMEKRIPLVGGNTQVPSPTNEPVPSREIVIVVDDFSTQPYQGDDVYYYNRLEGDRGALNDSRVDWGMGQARATISPGKSWGGIWMSLNHPMREALPINFSAILPVQILPAYQSTITGITVEIASGSPDVILRVELKNGDQFAWVEETTLSGGRQTLRVDLPLLQNINQLVLVLDHADPGEYVDIDHISFSASTPVTDTATAAFVWSYGMLLNNWDPATGLVRDKAKDASGEFDAIQATGSLAAATAMAEQLGIINTADAIVIVSKISSTLLDGLPRHHGLWPHWVHVSPEGNIDIVPDTEWSSVDTMIAAIGLLEAQNSLGLDTIRTEQMLGEIEWNNLVTGNGISHGYTSNGEVIPYAWDAFGGESWLVELVYAGVTGEVATLAYPDPPTANGSGFIDELAWLYILPPSRQDYWGTDWSLYRSAAVDKQIMYYRNADPDSCFARLGLFGVSAAEVPVPSQVMKESIYQAYGLGGQFAPANDGTTLLGAPVVSPHYSAMVASLEPENTTKMWDWLITQGYFSPLTNVESLTFPYNSDCTHDGLEWNQLKGSWNLALQSLGWGRYLAERDGQVPVLWQATMTNPLLHKGYSLLSPNEPATGILGSQPDEALAARLENAQISCEGEPLYKWSLPGIYRYWTSNDKESHNTFSVEQTTRWQQPSNESCPEMPWPGIGGTLADPPVAGSSTTGLSLCSFVAQVPYSEISVSIIGVEKIKTGLGTFMAMRVDATQEYRFQTMNHSDPSGIVNVSEWYVCGVGMIRTMTSHTWKYQTRNFQSQSELELFSFTPLP